MGCGRPPNSNRGPLPNSHWQPPPGCLESLVVSEPLRHVFTHFDLLIHPLWARFAGAPQVAEAPGTLWYNAALPASIGLPAPIAQLLRIPPP